MVRKRRFCGVNTDQGRVFLGFYVESMTEAALQRSDPAPAFAVEQLSQPKKQCS